MGGRTVLTEEELAIMDNLKEAMTEVIRDLVSNGVRKTNIEIELTWHVKNILRED